MSNPKDRATDTARQADWTEQDRMQQKYAYELAHPPVDTHEAEYDEANKRL